MIFGIDFSGLILFLKILSGIISIGFVVGIIYSWIGAKEVEEEFARKRVEHFMLEKPKKKESEHHMTWNTIRMMFQSQDSTQWRMAIIDADAMLEDMINRMGYQGETFGEKLKALQADKIPWIQAAWDVHLLRNKLAHEGSRYPLSNREAYRAFKIYENIFIETGYLS